MPAPFEPISATSSPGRDRQRDALQRPDVAVADVDVGRAQACRACPRYAAMTSGFAAHRRRIALGDQPAVVEDLDPIAQVHHQRDVVGDQDDRDPELVAQSADQRQQVLRLDRVHARVGLVEQQDLRLDADRPRDLEPTLVAVRQVAGRRGRAGRRARTARAAPWLDASSSALGAPEGRAREQRAEQRRLRPALERDLDVVEHRQVAEQPDVLEGPADAQPRDLVGRRAGDVAPVEGGSCRSSVAGSPTAG